MDEVFVREIRLPYKVKGATIKDSNGDYNVYLNSLIADEQKMNALAHELLHIAEGDFYKEEAAVEIEEKRKTPVSRRPLFTAKNVRGTYITHTR